MPVHNSTFPLAFHAWDEPMAHLRRLAADAGVPLVTPEIGRFVVVGEPADTGPWWQRLETRPPPVRCAAAVRAAAVSRPR